MRTPGDWFVEKSKMWGWCVRSLATYHSGVSGKQEQVFVASKLKNGDDARLFAASPRLLEACEYVLRMIQSHQVYDKDAATVLERAIRMVKDGQ